MYIKAKEEGEEIIIRKDFKGTINEKFLNDNVKVCFKRVNGMVFQKAVKQLISDLDDTCAILNESLKDISKSSTQKRMTSIIQHLYDKVRIKK